MTSRPDLDELIRTSVAAFNALPPEERARMIAAQALSWARSCVQNPGDRAGIYTNDAFMTAAYRLAGPRPACRPDTGEEPAWNVDLFEVERQAGVEAPTKPNWVDRSAWVAGQIIQLIDLSTADPELQPERGTNGLDLPHLLFMADQLHRKQVDGDTKACRWLGWLQAGVVAAGITDLETMKELNLTSGKLEGAGDNVPVPEPEPKPGLSPLDTALTYHGALLKCAERYRVMSLDVGDLGLNTFLGEFAARCTEGYPVPKLCRWLGYIQRSVIEHGLTTVEAERDWTRPLFRPLDFAEQNLGFQARSQAWLDRVTEDDPTDLLERIARFYEEATEWVQALGFTPEAAAAIQTYVFGRPAGEPAQEIGGMLTTAAVLAQFTGEDMMACGERELARVWDPAVIAKIRGKRSRRHGRGPLPGTTEEADLLPEGCWSEADRDLDGPGV